jgi:hypothetical protein
MNDVVEREMTITRSEFWRVLEKGFAEQLLSQSPRHAEIGIDGGRVALALSEQGTRRAGALQLPVLILRLEFIDVDEPMRRQFLERFYRTFQRGGG